MAAEIDVLSILGLSATSIANALSRSADEVGIRWRGNCRSWCGFSVGDDYRRPINGGFMAVFDELRTIGAPLVALFAGSRLSGR